MLQMTPEQRANYSKSSRKPPPLRRADHWINSPTRIWQIHSSPGSSTSIAHGFTVPDGGEREAPHP